MSKESNNIDRLVREKLDGFEMTPPKGAWENTSASLNGRRKKGFFLWFILSFVFLTAFATSIYFFAYQNDETKQLAVNDSSGQKEQLNQGNSNEESGPKSENNTSSTFSNNESDRESLSSNDNSNEGSFKNTNNTNTADADGNFTSSGRSDSQKQLTDKAEFNGKRTSNGDKRTNSSKRNGNDNDLNAKSDRRTPNLRTKNGSNKDGKDLADSRTLNDDTEKKSSGNNLSGNRTDSPSNSDSDWQRDRSNSSESETLENYASLPPRAAQELRDQDPSIVSDKVEARPLNISDPFWKAFSLEASIGMSIFRNVPKSTTPTNLLNALNAAASGERSLDVRLGVNYHFSNRFSLQSGIHYNASKENYSYGNEQIQTFTTFDTLSFSVDSITLDTTFMIDSNIFDSTIMTANSVLNSYRILTLPFQFAWSKPVSKRGTLEFAVGGALSIFGRNSGSLLNGDTIPVIDAAVGYQTTGLLSLGGSLKYIHSFGNHHSVYVEPWAQFGISNQSAPALNYESLRRRYGIRVGYRFYF